LAKASATTLTSQRRRSLRVHLDKILHAAFTGTRRGRARVRDLAIGGVFLETDVKFAVGDPIHVEILSGAKPFECDAIVRNVTRTGIGVEFVEMKPEERDLLRLLMIDLLA
jgi:PilZ domain-containing protein